MIEARPNEENPTITIPIAEYLGLCTTRTRVAAYVEMAANNTYLTEEEIVRLLTGGEIVKKQRNSMSTKEILEREG